MNDLEARLQDIRTRQIDGAGGYISLQGLCNEALSEIRRLRRALEFCKLQATDNVTKPLTLDQLTAAIRSIVDDALASLSGEESND